LNLLVLGENGSGKSAFAEKAAWELSRGGRLYYIACMIPYGEDGAKRVERHRKEREKYGFLLLEKPYHVSELEIEGSALLEDASNLLANAMFDLGKGASDVIADIMALASRCENLVAVSIDGKSLEGGYSEETEKYAEELKALNAMLSSQFDQVFHMGGGVSHQGLKKN
jgi:adenosylcobinamide kinase/adenosylcobinamide-phosphate guanylyltransferase